MKKINTEILNIIKSTGKIIIAATDIALAAASIIKINNKNK